MLYNKDWDQKLNYKRANKVLLDAADYIHNHGWCQGNLRDEQGHVCVMGAITAVTMRSHDDGTLAADLFRKFCGTSSVGYWNDKICQNEQQAIDSLLSATL